MMNTRLSCVVLIYFTIWNANGKQFRKKQLNAYKNWPSVCYVGKRKKEKNKMSTPNARVLLKSDFVDSECGEKKNVNKTQQNVLQFCKQRRFLWFHCLNSSVFFLFGAAFSNSAIDIFGNYYYVSNSKLHYFCSHFSSSWIQIVQPSIWPYHFAK